MIDCARDAASSPRDAANAQKAGGRMAQRDKGMKLRSRDGHFEMADFDLKHVEQGFWMWMECKFDGHNGGHWLAPDPQTPNALAEGISTRALAQAAAALSDVYRADANTPPRDAITSPVAAVAYAVTR